MTERRRARALDVVMPLAWMVAIFMLSNQPQLPSAPQGWLDWLIKKGLHAAGYGVLTLLWQRALARAGVRRAAWWSLAIAALYALTDEWHQTLVPGRHGRASDVAIDVAGAITALGWHVRDRPR